MQIMVRTRGLGRSLGRAIGKVLWVLQMARGGDG